MDLKGDRQSLSALDLVGQDVLGNPTSARGPALDAVNDFTCRFLGYEHAIGEILAAAETCPGAPLVQVFAGVLCMLSETVDGPAEAAPYAARAEGSLTGAPEREVRYAQALSSWAAGDRGATLNELEAIAARHPRDLVAVKLHQMLSFNRGRFDEMARIVGLSEPAADDLAPFHSMKAFALEELNQLEAAEQSANAALALRPDEPWAQHALAHVMLAQGRIEEGVAFLESRRSSWSGLNSFMLTHLEWHLALFYLSQGRSAEALALYDRLAWAGQEALAQDQVGAVSLLARIEMAGGDVGDRWRVLGHRLEARAEDTYEPFLAVQYLYGLVRAGSRPAAGRLLLAIRARAETDSDPVWRDAAAPLAEGLAQHGAGDVEAAAKTLRLVLPHVETLGGSHAQRDLFELITLDALQRSGDLAEAARRFEDRRRFDPDGAVTNAALFDIYAKLGNSDQAAAARERLHQTLARRDHPPRAPSDA